MKTKSINLQRVFNLGNYESIRIGGEWELEEGEDTNTAFLKADAVIKECLSTLQAKKAETATPTAPAPAEPTATPAPDKKVVEFGTKLHESVLARLTKGDIKDVDFLRQYYDFDEEVAKSFEFAIKVYGKKDEQSINK